MMVMAVRWLLLGVFLHLLGKVMKKILAEYIFDPNLYKPEPAQCEELAPSQVLTPIYQKRAS